ncbi:hypothetical protein D3C71_1284120 [compost metagenome]
MPEQRFTGEIRTPVAQQGRRFTNWLPRRVPHQRQTVLTHGIGHNAHRLCSQWCQRRNRRRHFTFALQLAKGFTNLLDHRTAVDVADHNQGHGIRGVPFLVEGFYLLDVDRLFNRLGRIVAQQR